MRFPGKATVAGLSLSLTAGTAWGADVCARAPDLVALQVAALQQQLMVAALTCDDVSLYNSFVTAYQKDLVASDEALQALATAIDSERDVKGGDLFWVQYEQEYTAEGDLIGTGRVLWAELRTAAKGTVAIHRFCIGKSWAELSGETTGSDVQSQ
jgi:hypothetical protein